MKLFVLTNTCTSNLHCHTCRNKEDGRNWRTLQAKIWEMPPGAPDFECPKERGAKPWGYNKVPAAGFGDLLTRAIDKTAEVFGRPVEHCQSCDERRQGLNKIVPFPKADPVKRIRRDHFDRVVLINLKRRKDRLERFLKNMSECQWPFKAPEIFEAVDGSKVPVPRFWGWGEGTWGCMQSHRQVLERAIMDGVRRLLVIEDDVFFRKDFGPSAKKFLSRVPANWDQLMIGGQLFADSDIEPVAEGVARVSNCQRTHCYAVQGDFIRVLYEYWVSTVGHCDHRMGEIQHKHNVFAAQPFLAGQAPGASDISGADDPVRFWDPPKEDAPVYLLAVRKEQLPRLRELGFHSGNKRDEDDIDIGLAEIMNLKPGPDRVRRLREWVDMIQWEAASMEGAVAAVYHPGLTYEELKEANGWGETKVYGSPKASSAA